MTKNDWTALGDEIKDLVQNTIDTQDFHKLNQNVRETIQNAAEVVNRSVRDAAGMNGRSNETSGYQKATYGSSSGGNASAPASSSSALPSRLYRKPLGAKALAIAETTGGGIFSFGIGIALLVLFLTGMFTGFGSGLWIAIGILLPLFAVFLALTLNGAGLFGRLKRFQRYQEFLGSRTYCSISDLAAQMGKTVGYTVKDLRTMITSGWFREGHLDREETCLITSHATYEEYLQLEARRPHLEAEARRRAETAKTDVISPDLPEEVRRVIEEGRSYVAKIRESNDRIPGEGISAKISRLELIVQRIFDHIEQHPDRVSETRKLMEYYLPTTIKLLNAYEELDRQPVQGKNILSSKQEIEDTLDTLNLAFERLLDKLFQDVAWDVSTDISVLHTMLAQEGLTGQDFTTTH